MNPLDTIHLPPRAEELFDKLITGESFDLLSTRWVKYGESEALVQRTSLPVMRKLVGKIVTVDFHG